jgi:hypothetical protein
MDIVRAVLEEHKAGLSVQEDITPLGFDVELRLSPRWVGGNIESTDATKHVTF